ncbi:MAG: DUF2079 domain-containing protein [Candidatus Eremiobacteraeota bacterium]|nr:DUF2079 domain-containing protein [Candidatus Eremiobacteraeota bacterium]
MIERGFVWVAAGSASYALVAGALVVVHWNRWLAGVDTGIFTQVVLNSFHGFRSAFENGSDFAVHFSPLLIVFYPLLALTHSGLALLLAQVVLIAAVPCALYALVRPHLDEALATRMGFIALLYPPLAAIGLGDFHILACLPLLIIGLLGAADRGRWGWFAVLAIAALGVREDVALELAVIGMIAGIVLLRAHRGIGTLFSDAQRRHEAGIAFVALGAGALGVCIAYFGFIQPANARYGWYPLLYYHYGARPRSGVVAQPPVAPPPNPAATPIGAALQRISYLIEAFVPLALLPLVTRWWLLALPGLIVVLASTAQSIRTMGTQYSLLWAPWPLIATALALIVVMSTAGERAAAQRASAAIALCVLFLIAFNPMHVGYYLRAPYRDLAAAQRALACVPPDASFATHDEWFTHVAGTRALANGDVVDGVEYLVYADDYNDATFEREIKPKLHAQIATGRWRVTCSEGAVKTYQRVR